MIPQIELYKELYKRGNYTIQVETPWGKHEKQEKALELLNNNSVAFVGYGGSARCKSGDTLVLTDKGHIPIQKIKEGDIVLTYNEDTKRREYNKVLKKYAFICAEPPKMIKFVNGITCTEEHELLFRGQWTKAIELRKRALGESRRPLLHFNKREVSNVQSSKLKEVKNNEAIINRGLRKNINIDKRCDTKKKLGSREVNYDDFIGSELIRYDDIIYDLHVENNHNYVVSKDNIITHNSGKSWVECEWLTMQCLCYDGVGYGLARKELKTLKRTTLLTLFKVFQKYNLQKDIDYNYNQQESVITFSNGSQIFLIDTAYKPSDPLNTRFGGYELTGCVIDESNETNYDVIEILSGRCGFRLNDRYDINSTVLEAFNPDKGHVYERYYKPNRDNKESEETKFVKALPSDNPDPQVKKWLDVQLKTSSEITIQRLVKGNFDYDESLDKLVDSHALNDLFSNQFIEPKGNKYLTADIARMGSDATVIRVWHGLRVIERIEIKKSLVTDTAKSIRNICNRHQISMSKCLVDEDGVGGGVKDILNCLGFVANSRPLGKTNYTNLKSQCGWKIAELINDRKVYENCTDRIILDKIKQEIDWLREKDVDKDGKLALVSKDIIKQFIRRSPDDLDTYIMRAYFEIGQKL